MYIKNIEYLKNNEYNLYKKIVLFEEKNNEDYSLEFIDNHFEIVDKHGQNTYNCDPFFDAQYRVNNLYSKPSHLLIIDENTKKLKSTDKFESNKFINEFTELFINNNDAKKFNKMMFIGTLLGVHINDIHNECKCETYLILEDNIEIFRLSLFLTDYETISTHSKIFFAIDEQKSKTTIIEKFLDYNYQDNNIIKFELASQKSISTLEDSIKEIVKYNPSIYPFSEIIRSYINGLDNFQNSINGILDLSKKYKILHQIPVLFLASGPSLEKNIEVIQKIQKNIFIVTAISSLKKLESANIVPDMIISIDSDEYVLNTIDTVDEKYYKNSFILTSINANKKVFQKLNTSKTYLVQNSLELFPQCGYFTGVTVGDVGIKILLQLGVKVLYLCGIDASMDQQSGLTHIDTHITNKQIELSENSIFEKETLDYYETVIKVKGNFQDEVYSTLYYKTIIDSLKNINVNGSSIYNISSGAYLPNTIPTKVGKLLEIKTRDKKNHHIIKNLNKITKKDLSRIDVLNFKRELDACLSKNVNIKGTVIYEIINQYNLLIKPYYTYLINNYNTDKKDADKILYQQMNIIFEVLSNSLKKVLLK